MKKILSFDIDNTLNEPKMPIFPEMAELLATLSQKYTIAPISGQKYDQFLIQIINNLPESANLDNFHLFVGQGTQYYAHKDGEWKQIFNFALTDTQVAEISAALKKGAEELGYWDESVLAPGDEIIENRESMIAYSAIGQAAGVEAKKAWDPDMTKRNAIAKIAKELAPSYDFEVAGTTTINAFVPGQNKEFGMNHMMEHLNVTKPEILYFGDMTQPGGNDYPVVQMGIETITVRDWKETAAVLKAIIAMEGIGSCDCDDCQCDDCHCTNCKCGKD
ncbi:MULTISPECIES: HAD-IIB family hydrolase [unclassified Lactococcus]|uniref:HAD-IIB family hydrolase n=1 Tax=unclassified Lactococcus TaxID=2643510 RepID=UPI0011C9109C|nr:MULTISPECIES: HAD-IIB family hydrolase [unclassified Lactococcus]MQW22373.1 HAD-IIB family hydrolase [Lactococcus sp. dk101]TXK45409.1 HAD-IIB family hydrolase [Lactococcus sp. dk310]TXK51742.1 HAD-IIB family hydrolase [Lactococcus sp. dk322]